MKINLSHPLCPEVLGKRKAMQHHSPATWRTWRPPSRASSLADLTATCATTPPWIAHKEPLVSVSRHRATQLLSDLQGFKRRPRPTSPGTWNLRRSSCARNGLWAPYRDSRTDLAWASQSRAALLLRSPQLLHSQRTLMSSLTLPSV